MAKASNAVKLPKADPELLRTWRTLDVGIMQCSEDECWQLLMLEKQGKARRLFLQRIYGRASTLRGKREAQEIREAARDI